MASSQGNGQRARYAQHGRAKKSARTPFLFRALVYGRRHGAPQSSVGPTSRTTYTITARAALLERVAPIWNGARVYKHQSGRIADYEEEGGGVSARLGSAENSTSDASHGNARASNAVPSVSFTRFQFGCGRNENAHRRGTEGRKINRRKYSSPPALAS